MTSIFSGRFECAGKGYTLWPLTMAVVWGFELVILWNLILHVDQFLSDCGLYMVETETVVA